MTDRAQLFAHTLAFRLHGALGAETLTDIPGIEHHLATRRLIHVAFPPLIGIYSYLIRSDLQIK